MELSDDLDLALGYALCPRCGESAKGLWADGVLVFVRYCDQCKEVLGVAGEFLVTEHPNQNDE